MRVLFGWPSLRAIRLLGRAAAAIAWLVAARGRHVTLTNLALCVPELDAGQRHRLARASVAATTQLVLESIALWSRAPAASRRWIVDVDGEDEVARALERGNGAICLVPHFGNWEVLNSYLGQRFPFTGLFAPQRNRWADAWIRSARERSGAELVPTTRAGLRRLRAALADGRLIGLLPDQVPDDGAGVSVPFFGQPALTGTLAVRLANSAKCAVFIAFALRDETLHGFRIGFRQLALPSAEQGTPAALRAVHGEMERLILEAPAQYQWEYKRFKHAIQGVDLYKQSR